MTVGDQDTRLSRDASRAGSRPGGELDSPDGEAAHPDGEAAHPDGEATHPDGEATHPDGEATHPDGEATHPEADPARGGDRAADLERRFSLPVIIAAIASIPAVFLTMMGGTAKVVGDVVNYATLAVFAAEFLTLLWAVEDKRRWVREHKLVIIVLVAAIPAVILFVGAVQALRLGHLATRFLAGITHFVTGATHTIAGTARFVTGLKIAQVRRLFRAFRKLRERTGLRGWRWNAVRAGFVALGVVALALVLADSESATRQFLEGLVEAYGVPVLIGGTVAVAVLGAGGVAAYRRWGDRLQG